MKDQYIKHLDSINEYAILTYKHKMTFRKAVKENNKGLADKATYENVELARSWRQEYSGIANLCDKELEEILLLEEIPNEEKEIIRELWYGSRFIRNNINIVKLIGTARAMIKERYFMEDGVMVNPSIYNVQEKALQYLRNNPVEKD